MLFFSLIQLLLQKSSTFLCTQHYVLSLSYFFFQTNKIRSQIKKIPNPNLNIQAYKQKVKKKKKSMRSALRWPTITEPEYVPSVVDDTPSITPLEKMGLPSLGTYQS